MNRIEAVFPLNGELNRYPFDRYRTTLWLLMTAPPRKKSVARPSGPESTENEGLRGDHLAVGTTALQQCAIVPLTITLSAPTPGIKFGGNVSRESGLKATGIEVEARRADNVIGVSILVMLLMMGLATATATFHDSGHTTAMHRLLFQNIALYP